MTDSQEQRKKEKEKAEYEKGYKAAAKFYDRNPKFVPPGPIDDLLKIKADAEEEAKKTIQNIKENQRYRPTPIAASWADVIEYQKKLYPANFKTHNILVEDTAMGLMLRVLWQANSSTAYMGQFSKTIRQLISIIKRGREDYGVRMQVIDGGKKVVLVDSKGNKTQPRPPEDWEKWEYGELFAGARRL